MPEAPLSGASFFCRTFVYFFFIFTALPFDAFSTASHWAFICSRDKGCFDISSRDFKDAST